MGHPGDDAIMPLAKMASEAGILMMYQNVDVPAVRAAYGGGYVGANLATQGKELAREAIRRFDLKAGDTAIVMVPIGDYSRAQREDGFDTSPQIMTAFENGYVHLTSDQQPFLQGYLPVLALCQMKVLGTGALNQDTGAGFVHTENYKSVMELANAGLR